MTNTGSKRPTPPTELDEGLREALEGLAERDPSMLEAVATYADDLTTWLESTEDATSPARTADGDETASESRSGSARPEKVPEHATVSKTEIGGTTYRYYQWRDGDEIRSTTVELE